MIPKPTENTITSLLKEELEKFGVKAEPFVSVHTPVGRREVDLLCRNAGVYPCEAKFTEDRLIEAIAKIQNDYLKFYEILGVKGGFALLYSKELAKPMPIETVKSLAYKLKFKVVLMFPPKDNRNFSVREGTLTEIAKILAEQVLTPPTYIEPSIDYMIRSLRESAMYIVNGLRYLAGPQLEGIFGGKNVFRNILQYEERKYPVEDLRLAAAYLLINQILFYHVLSRTIPEKFPEIDTDVIKQPADLNHYFKRVLDVNYKTVFSYDVASRIPPNFTNEVKVLINVVKGISPEKVRRDLLGTIFHDLVPFEVRKSVAAFYTNILAAELLANLAIDRWDAKVADFACGSGGLLVAAYRRKKELLERERSFTQEDHHRFVEEDLLGVDVMPFAANIAACHLALQSPEYFTNKVQIAIWDSTELKPGKKIPSVARLETVLTGQVELDYFREEKGEEVKGVVVLGEEKPEEIQLSKYDVIIMNPPFTRQERIQKEYKEKLFERFSEYKDYLSGRLGYYGYFILLADKFLKENGRIALVLPATVLRIKTCESLRRLWSEKYHVKYIVATSYRSAFSESVRFREILLIAEKVHPSDEAKTCIATLKELPTTIEEARKIAMDLKNITRDTWENEKASVRIISYKDLTSNVENWFKYIAISDLALLEILEYVLKSNKLTPFLSKAEAFLSNLYDYKFGDFHGFVLHEQSRALKEIDVWIMEKLLEGELEARHTDSSVKVRIPLSVLGRGIRRPSYVTKINVTKDLDYLILSWFKEIKELARFLLPNSLLKNFNAQHVDAWRRNFEQKKTNLLLSRRLDISAPGTSLISFYSETPMVGVDMWCMKGISDEYAKILVLWLNSSLNLLQTFILRTETRGAWIKIHDYMLNEILVPDLDKLSESDLRILQELFTKVESVEFPCILSQLKNRFWARVLIDKAWLQVLGYEGDYNQLLNKLYSSLANEIETLKRLMAEGTVQEEDTEEDNGKV